MDTAEVAKKVDALEAELAAKSSRIADLEARVSLLEAENTVLMKAMRKGDAMDHTGGRVGNDAMEVGDGQEEGVAVDVNKGKSAEEGVPPVLTPVKSAERVVTWRDGEDTKQAGGVGGGDQGGDDFPSIPRRKKKRKSTVVISDSDIEGEDDNGEGHGIEDVHGKHVPCVAESGSGKEESDEDDGKTISEMIKERTRDDELGETKECSIPARKRPSRRALDFGEPKDHEESEDGSEEEESEDGSEEADSSADFIDDEDCSDNPSNTSEEYSPEPPQESDSEVNYKVVIDRIGRRRNASTKEWEYEGDMLSAFAKQPELRLKAVCALYRKQTEEEQSEKATIVHNKQGFSQIDARRGSNIAQFLLDGDASGPLKKTVQDLEKYHPRGLKVCHRMASRYSKQLFAIYKNKEDPYFP